MAELDVLPRAPRVDIEYDQRCAVVDRPGAWCGCHRTSDRLAVAPVLFSASRRVADPALPGRRQRHGERGDADQPGNGGVGPVGSTGGQDARRPGAWGRTAQRSLACGGGDADAHGGAPVRRAPSGPARFRLQGRSRAADPKTPRTPVLVGGGLGAHSRQVQAARRCMRRAWLSASMRLLTRSLT
jgi:hypothetical protein